MKQLSQLELKVITDDLTGLYNRRYLNEKLREETRRSLSKKGSFGLIMLDLDHFKEVNDNYGHSEGDQALIWISNILRESVREGDIVIRFAGDEFFLILPGAGLDDAKLISKRIYQNISSNPFRGSKAQISIPVGVSGGIAIYPEDAKSVEDLIKSADSGLYLAKEQGRGKVCFASDAKIAKDKKINKSQLLSPPFIGRESEIKKLKKGCLTLLKDSENMIFLIQGDTGMGKSRLIEEFLLNIPQKSFLSLTSVCFPHDFEIPYQPIIDLIKTLVARDKESFEGLILSLTEKEQSALLKLLPNFELSSTGTASSPEKSIEGGFDNSNLYYAVANIIQNLALKKPLIIIIEDIQWMDMASLDLLSHIVSQTATLPIFFVFTMQTYLENETKNQGVLKFVRRLRRLGKFEKILLEPLDNNAIKKIISKIFNPDNAGELYAIERLLCSEAEGNPLFIKELLLKIIEEKILIFSGNAWKIDKTKVLETPNLIKDIVTGRIETMNEDLKNVLEKASVIGKEFIFKILQQVVEMNEGHLLDLLDNALSDAFLIENTASNEESFTFSSYQIQKALYENLSAIRKKRIHQKVMEIIEKQFHSKREDFIEVLFFHAQKAKEHSKTFLYGFESGMKAFNNCGLMEARNFFEETIKAYENFETEYRDLYIEQYKEILFYFAETLKLLGEYTKALDIISSLPGSPSKNELLASVHMKNGNYIKAISLYENALVESDDLKLKCKIKTGLADIYFKMGKYSLASDNAKEAFDIAIKINKPELEALALKTLGSVCFYQNNLADSIKYYRVSLKSYQKLEDRSGISGVLNNIGLVHYKKRKYKLAERCFLKAKTICDETGFHSLSLVILNNLGNVYLDTDQTGWAEEYFSEALALSEDSGDVSTSIACYINLGNLFHEKDPQKSESFHLKGLELCSRVGEASKESYFYNALGEVAKKKGDYEKSENWYIKAINLRKKLNELENQIFSQIKLLELYESLKKIKKLKILTGELEKLFHGKSNKVKAIIFLKQEFESIKERCIDKSLL